MDACYLAKVDRLNDIYTAAWANVMAKSLKAGDTYTDLFDYEAAIKKVDGSADELDPRLLKIAKRVQEFKRKEDKHE